MLGEIIFKKASQFILGKIIRTPGHCQCGDYKGKASQHELSAAKTHQIADNTDWQMNHPAASNGVSTKDKIDLSSQATGY